MTVAARSEAVPGWGLYNVSVSPVYRPSTEAELAESLEDCRRKGLTVCFRGAGRSYGDAALNQGGAVINLEKFDRILSFDEASGVIQAQGGVTIEKLWRWSIAKGYWPPVVPGTMYATLGGCAAMNIHGKNQWKAGSFGEHVASLRLMDAGGRIRDVPPGDPLFRRVIGGAGIHGAILEVRLRLKKLRGGHLRVSSFVTESLEAGLREADAGKERDYVVGWIDCFARGKALGRGLFHTADYVKEDDPLAGRGFSVTEQDLPSRLLGVFPRGLAWRFLRPFVRKGGMGLINGARYAAGRWAGARSYAQSLAAFNFLLDYVPEWRKCYWPGGFIQYQFFIPFARAAAVFRRAIELQHELGVVSFLGVLKRHRADPFEDTYLMDGFSLALDFPVTAANASRLRTLCARYDELVEKNGGRYYLAKDSFSHILERRRGLGPLGLAEPS